MNKRFNNQELEIINADIFDTSQDIYARKKFNLPNLFPNTYIIKCSNLPAGNYIAQYRYASLHFNTTYRMEYDKDYAVDPIYSGMEECPFRVNKDGQEVIIKVTLCTRQQLKQIVKQFREQSIVNLHLSEKKMSNNITEINK